MGELGKEWQDAGDDRLFKIIISPEDGQEANFEQLADALVTKLEEQTGTHLEWAGIVHRNTEHPHAHLMVRGRTETGTLLHIDRKVIQHDLREAVQSSLTQQLGARTLDEVARQNAREIHSFRPTGIDHRLAKSLGPHDEGKFAQVQVKKRFEEERLKTLESIGLAKHDENSWYVRTDFRQQLKQMADLQDRARTLFRSGVAISDPHAPMEMLQQSRKLIGRVLLNSEDERTGQMQSAIETVDGKIAIIRHDQPLRGAWIRGDLKPGNIIAIDSVKSDPGRLYVAAIGADKDVLQDPRLTESTLSRLRRMGIVLADTDKGWLGDFSKAAAELQTKTLRKDFGL